MNKYSMRLYAIVLAFFQVFRPAISLEVINASLYPIAWRAYHLEVSSFDEKKNFFLIEAQLKLKQLEKYVGKILLTKSDLLDLYKFFFETISNYKINRYFESYDLLLKSYVSLRSSYQGMNAELIPFSLNSDKIKNSINGRIALITLLYQEYTEKTFLFREIQSIINTILDVENKKNKIKKILGDVYLQKIKKINPNKNSKFYDDFLKSSFLGYLVATFGFYELFRYQLKEEGIGILKAEYAKFISQYQYFANPLKIIIDSWDKSLKKDNNTLESKDMIKDWTINIPVKALGLSSGFNLFITNYDLWKNKAQYELLNKTSPVLKFGLTIMGLGTMALNLYFSYGLWKNRYYAFRLYQLYKLESRKIQLVKKLFLCVDSLYKKRMTSSDYSSMPVHREYKYLSEIIVKKNIKKDLNYLISFDRLLKLIQVQGAFSMYFDYYYNNVLNNPVFDIIDQFISSIDLAIAKIKLLEKTKEVCIPKIHFAAKKPFINIKNLYLPVLNNGISNSIFFDENNRCICLAAPIASGKTVFLSAFWGNFIFAQTGIVPAEYSEFSYFDIIVSKIKEAYVTGEGESKGSSEVKDMYNLKKTVEEEEGLKLCVVDEIYSGLNHEDATDFAKEDIDFFVNREKKDVVFLITTHIPEVANYVVSLMNKGLDMRYFYFKIDYSYDQGFVPTYHLCQDIDGNDLLNWYLKDKELRKKYIKLKM
jgi:hypothetical protein